MGMELFGGDDRTVLGTVLELVKIGKNWHTLAFVEDLKPNSPGSTKRFFSGFLSVRNKAKYNLGFINDTFY